MRSARPGRTLATDDWFGADHLPLGSPRGNVDNSTYVTLSAGDFAVDEAQLSAAAPAKRPTWAQAEGSPLPLGVTRIDEEQALNFAIHSEHAESVTLLLYSSTDLVNPLLTYRFDFLHNKSGRIWHCRIPIRAIREARYYAYSVSGQTVPQLHSFDPQKVLLDPYAKCVFFPPGFDRELAMREGSNAGRAPLGVLSGCHSMFDWSGDRSPLHESDAIIYELHVKGFTKNPNSGVDPSRAGTYAGLVEKIPYLKELGITIVELMPIFQRDPQEGDYWGYMPLNFFAPHAQYASSRDDDEQHIEFRNMVKAFHQAGIRVVLDVVYNHTCEGDHRGPIYSYKGIDSAGYYMLSSDPANPYVNYSGTGNTLNFSHGHVRKMVLDSLRFWNQEMHIDGFRFDLASIFSRNADGSLNWGHAPIFSEIAADPELSRLYLIAEPWDAGAYQLGRGFPGITWRQAQWANGHNNQDGTDDNYSWNCGHEGEEGAPSAVLGLRRKQVKNFCCLLMLSNGTPMFRAGDEFLNTQFGNNNPYNQDNETGWLDWSQLRANEDIFRFFKCMIAFRKNHPSLGRSRFWREDISWYGTGSTVDLSNDSHSLAFCLHGASQDDDDVYVMINGYWEDLEFHVQEGTAEEWKRIVDTALPGPNDFLGDLPDQGVTLERTSYLVAPRSIVMLLRTRRR